MKYFKELELLRNQLIRKKIDKGKYQYVEIRYFNAADGLSDKVTELLNIRIKEAQDFFDRIVYDIHQHYEALSKQVKFYDKYPDLILKHSKATAENLIQRMSIIEPNSRIVWRAIEENYGEDFFKRIIELDYGMS